MRSQSARGAIKKIPPMIIDIDMDMDIDVDELYWTKKQTKKRKWKMHQF